MLFTGFYLESSPGSENYFIQNFFEVELKVDVLLLRMVLDIVTKVLKSVEPFDEAFDNSAFLNSSQKFDRNSILDAIENAENEDINMSANFNASQDLSQYSSARSNRGMFSMAEQKASSNFSFKIDVKASQMQSQQIMEQTYEEEEEDEFMKEDHTTWDIFKDAHKFARREQILEKRKKKEVEEELNAIRSDRLHQEG